MELISAIESYFPVIKRVFSKEDFEIFLHCSYTNLHDFHLGLGTWIRNNIVLKDRSLEILFQKCGIDNQDEMSMLIIELFYLYENLKKAPC